MLMGICVDSTFNRVDDTIFIGYLCELLFLFDIDRCVLDPSVKCISFRRFLRMENCIL